MDDRTASSGELRRQLRDMGAEAERDHRALRTALRAMFERDVPEGARRDALVGRRRFLTIGGLGVATAAVVAACGEEGPGGVARVGVAPTRTTLPDGILDEALYLRTAASIERSAIAVYDQVIGTDLLAPQLQDAARRFRDDHVAHTEILDELTEELGAEPWTCGNPRIDEFLVAPVLARITGDEATGVDPSDDPRRDTANFAHALETLAGETYQALVASVNDPLLRQELIRIGSTEVRHAAILAIAITGRPAGYLPGDGQEETDFPVVHAIPARFGQLGGQNLVVGAPDEFGVRTSFSVDTPSLNTFIYDFMNPAC